MSAWNHLRLYADYDFCQLFKTRNFNWSRGLPRVCSHWPIAKLRDIFRDYLCNLWYLFVLSDYRMTWLKESRHFHLNSWILRINQPEITALEFGNMVCTIRNFHFPKKKQTLPADIVVCKERMKNWKILVYTLIENSRKLWAGCFPMSIKSDKQLWFDPEN